MARPPSTTGGRPHLIGVRLSESELAALDARRGTASRVGWLRAQITQAAPPLAIDEDLITNIEGDTRALARTKAAARATREVARDSPVEDHVPAPAAATPEAAAGDQYPGIPKAHRHRRGEVVKKAIEKGAWVAVYGCADTTCSWQTQWEPMR